MSARDRDDAEVSPDFESGYKETFAAILGEREAKPLVLEVFQKLIAHHSDCPDLVRFFEEQHDKIVERDLNLADVFAFDIPQAIHETCPLKIRELLMGQKDYFDAELCMRGFLNWPQLNPVTKIYLEALRGTSDSGKLPQIPPQHLHIASLAAIVAGYDALLSTGDNP